MQDPQPAGGADAVREAKPAASAPPTPSDSATGARWARAVSVRAGKGVRSEAPTSVQLVCDTGMYSLDAALQQREVPGWYVLGQVFLRDNAPAEEIDVVLHVDEEAVDRTRTDAFGEFAFTSRAGRRIGVALHGPELAHVELWRGE